MCVVWQRGPDLADDVWALKGMEFYYGILRVKEKCLNWKII